MVISDVYRSFIRNKTTFTKYCLTQWISKLPWSFEIHWVRHYLVNFTCLAGILYNYLHDLEGQANFHMPQACSNFLYWILKYILLMIAWYEWYPKTLITLVLFWIHWIFSCRGADLDHVMYRMGVLACLRSKVKKGELSTYYDLVAKLNIWNVLMFCEFLFAIWMILIQGNFLWNCQQPKIFWRKHFNLSCPQFWWVLLSFHVWKEMDVSW